MKSDSQLQRDVIEELAWSPMIDHAQIGVAAKDGVVTLAGFVPDYAQKMAAEKAARAVAGVKAIAEEIEVRFADEPKVSDSEIAGRIVRILDWDPSVPKQGIAVKVEHGWVTLSGEVEWNFQKQEARAAAGRVGGVRGVLNLIAIRPRTTASDVRARIVDAFERSSALDAEAIDVEVKDGIVRLRGKVRGWNERRVAENAAWSAPGVTKVEDDIVLA